MEGFLKLQGDIPWSFFHVHGAERNMAVRAAPACE